MKNKLGLTAKEAAERIIEMQKELTIGLSEIYSDSKEIINNNPENANLTDLSESGQAIKFIIRNFLEGNGYAKYRLTEREYRKNKKNLTK